MRRFTAILALGAALLAAPSFADAPSGDNLRLLDQFMQARSAAMRCGKANSSTLAAFRSNYRAIALQGRAELHGILTDLDESLIEKVLTDHYSDIDRKVAAMITQESCDGPHLREALQYYERNGQMVSARLGQSSQIK